MLWSLIKIILFVVIIAALTLGAGYLLEVEGGIRVSIASTEFTLGPLAAVVALVALVVLVWVALKLLSLLVATVRFLNGDETAISRYFDRNRERKGFQALADGLMALASGEAKVAATKAARAERYLRRPELTNLISAQAAEMTGDTKKAEEVYKRLLTDERTQFVGVRGIMKQRLDAGDNDTARKLAEKAFDLKPRHEETQDILLRLQAEHGDWTGARRTLEAKRKYGRLPRDVHRRRDAVLALSEAKGVFDEDQPIEARIAAIEANRLSPDLIPAAAMAARGYIAQSQPRYATKVLKKAWDVQPHPDLAAAFAEIEPDETPEARLKRFRGLVKSRADDPESRMLMAELHIAAEDFPGARAALGDLATDQPTARSLTIMAAVERGAGAEDAVVRGWLTRALSASRGPQWVCDNCQTVASSWVPVCEACHAFDTLSWRVPSEGEMAGSTGMLPLIVGAAAPSEVAVVEPETEDAGTPDKAAEEPAKDGEVLEGESTEKA